MQDLGEGLVPNCPPPKKTTKRGRRNAYHDGLYCTRYNWIWKNEYASKRWREGVIVNLFKKGDEADPGNCRGINAIKHRR